MFYNLLGPMASSFGGVKDIQFKKVQLGQTKNTVFCQIFLDDFFLPFSACSSKIKNIKKTF